MKIGSEGSSTLKTVGKVAGVTAGVAAAGSLVYAAKTGKGDTFVKKVGDGYQTLGSKIAKKAGEAVEWVKSKLPKAKDNITTAANETADEAQTAAQTVVETAGQAAQAAGEAVANNV